MLPYSREITKEQRDLLTKEDIYLIHKLSEKCLHTPDSIENYEGSLFCRMCALSFFRQKGLNND